MKTYSEVTTGTLNEFQIFYPGATIYAEQSQEVYNTLKDECESEMLESDEFWCGKFDYEGDTYGIMADGAFTSSGEYLVAKLL